MKKKILIVLLVISIFLIGILTIFKITNKVNDEEEKITNDNIHNVKRPSLDNIKVLDICKDLDNCNFDENLYGDLTFEYDNSKIQEWIKKINKETYSYYDETINSKTNSEECMTIKDVYNYRLVTNSYFNNYIGDDYISLSIRRIKNDLCTNEILMLPTEVIIYNKSSDKIVLEDELKSELNLTDDFIKEKIKNSIESFTDVPNGYDFSNYVLYFDITGSLLAEYYLDGKNYAATILY